MRFSYNKSILKKIVFSGLIFALVAVWQYSGWLPKVPVARAAVCADIGTDIGGGQCRVFLTTADSSPFAIPEDWSDTNTFEVIGGGGAGANGVDPGSSAGAGGAGGGGGGYASASNVTGLAGNITFSVGTGGTTAGTNGNDTWFNGSVCVGSSACATAGGGGTGQTGGSAGGVQEGTGNAGGTGGGGESPGNGGGGGGAGAGAGGANGTGNSGGAGSGQSGNSGGNGGTGGQGDSTSGGTGGGGGSGGANGQNGNPGTAGNNGTEWNSSPDYGSGGGGGGGGGGGRNSSSSGGGATGGTYGAGGGAGGGAGRGGTGPGSFASGRDGVIVITYTIDNVDPVLNVDQPDGTADIVLVGNSYNIQYDLTDPDNDVTAAFYYDDDGAGLDGTAITGACATAAEGTDVTCSWNTTGVTPGDYYVYGIADDTVNPAVNDYSPGMISIVSGAFNAYASSSQSFDSEIPVEFFSQTSTMSDIGALSVEDDRVSTPGWNFTLAGNDWKYDTGVVQMEYNGGGSDDNQGKLCAFPNTGTTLYAVVGSLTGVAKGSDACFSSGVSNIDIITASNGNGHGTYWLVDMPLEQFIPATPKAQEYTTTVVFTIQ